MQKNILKAQELLAEITKIVNSVDMCKAHHDQLIEKIDLYFKNNHNVYQSTSVTTSEKDSCCSSGGCGCSGTE